MAKKSTKPKNVCCFVKLIMLFIFIIPIIYSSLNAEAGSEANFESNKKLLQSTLFEKGDFVKNIKSLRFIEMGSDILSFFGNIIEAFKSIGSLFYNTVIEIFNKGKWVTEKTGMFKENPSYMHFQIGFVQGYVTGYVGEQVLAFKGITKALEALKIGAKVSKSIEDIYSIIQKIGDTLGEKVINILTKSKVIGKNADSIAKWASEAAELGLGRIAKYFDTVEDFDKYLEDVGDLKKFSETVNEVAIKYGDDVAEVLVKSRYVKEALKAGWSIWELNGLNEIIKNGEDILKRIAEKYGQEALQKTASIVGQGSIKWGRNQLTSLAYVVKYSTDYDPELFIQLKKLSNR